MKLRPILLASLAACSCAAVAQSSVTVFGVVDLAGRYVSNDQSQYQLATSGDRASRLGFRGTEDLGGGLSAGFWLEAPLNPDTADANFSFSRRATVSLVSHGGGELRLGRDMVPTYYEWLEFDPFGDGGLGRSTRLAAASGIVPSGGVYSTTVRADNLVSYFTPGALGGLFAQLSMAAGEGQLGNKYYGGRIGYRDGVLAGSMSWGNTQVTANDDAVIWNIGGAYDFQSLQLTGFYSELEIGSSSQSNWQLGLAAPFGPWLVRGSYQAMTGKGDLSNQEAWGLAVGAVYSLSKRTALYATYSTISNTNSSFAVSSGPPLTPGNDSSGFDLGLRHSF
jgi:predicted porin